MGGSFFRFVSTQPLGGKYGFHSFSCCRRCRAHHSRHILWFGRLERCTTLRECECRHEDDRRCRHVFDRLGARRYRSRVSQTECPRLQYPDGCHLRLYHSVDHHNHRGNAVCGELGSLRRSRGVPHGYDREVVACDQAVRQSHEIKKAVRDIREPPFLFLFNLSSGRNCRDCDCLLPVRF